MRLPVHVHVHDVEKVGEVEQSMHAISAKLYEAAAAEMDDQSEEPAGSDDVVDADFEVVDED